MNNVSTKKQTIIELKRLRLHLTQSMLSKKLYLILINQSEFQGRLLDILEKIANSKIFNISIYNPENSKQIRRKLC